MAKKLSCDQELGILAGVVLGALSSLSKFFREDSYVLGPITDFMEKISGKNGVEWWEKFKKFLNGELCQAAYDHQWKIWKTTQFKSSNSSSSVKSIMWWFNARKIIVGKWVSEILSSITPRHANFEVKLVRVTVSELGFTEKASFWHVCSRAIDRGLSLCSIETATSFYLGYTDQPLQERLFVAMKTVLCSDGQYRTLWLGHLPKGFHIETVEADPSRDLCPKDVLLFELECKKL